MCRHCVGMLLAILLAFVFACTPAEIHRSNCFAEKDGIHKISLLQIDRHSTIADAKKHLQDKPDLKVEKLTWMHVPKTGTSFANVLLSYACPNLPDSLWVNESYRQGQNSYQYVKHFMSTHGKQFCPSSFTLCGAAHIPICCAPDIPLGKGCMDWSEKHSSFVTMLRQPEQRIISGFNHGLHDCRENCIGFSLSEYAQAVSGIVVRMLNGYPVSDIELQITPDMIANAIHRLETGFAFVGLTEQWSLSVCLFHKMFGGQPRKRDFLDIRPGNHHAKLYDISGLRNFSDPYDGPVYARAEQLFWSNVEKFNVTRSACQELYSEFAPYFND